MERKIFVRSKKVKIISILSISLAALWIISFGWAVKDYYGADAKDVPKETHAPLQKRYNDELTIVAMGDSLTRGTGDETGKGYVGLVTEEIKKRFKGNVIVHNLGIKGQTSAQLLKQVKQTEIQRQISAADTVLITIGGNDLFQQGQTLMSFDEDAISLLQNEYLKNLKFVFSDIRKANSHASIFLVGLYNPFIDLEDSAETSRVVREWNFQTAELASVFPKTVFVPTFDLFQLSAGDYLYTDKFHPNKTGYRLIAERVTPLIKWEEQQ
jgi:lysophospholipase L1-like esterase